MIAWLKIIRLPNLLTVPGDPLAGFYLAAFSLNITGIDIATAIKIMLAVLAFYSAGMIINDLVDIKEDTDNHLPRPLVDGSIKPLHAKIISRILLLGGLWLCFKTSSLCGALGIILVIAIFVYNFWAKKHPSGAIVMGLCRGISFLLGASILGLEALSNPTIIAIASAEVIYIIGITLIAHQEQKETEISFVRFLPFATIFISLSYLLQIQEKYSLFFLGLGLMASSNAFRWAYKLSGEVGPKQVGPAIGGLIANLIFFQACIISINGEIGFLVAGAALIFFNLGKILRQKFYAT